MKSERDILKCVSVSEIFPCGREDEDDSERPIWLRYAEQLLP
jgi:hypothetical protein